MFKDVLVTIFGLYWLQEFTIPVVLAENSGRCNKNDSDEKVQSLCLLMIYYHVYPRFQCPIY